MDRVWERKAFGTERKACMQVLRGKVLGTFSGQFSACCVLNIGKQDTKEKWTKGMQLWSIN